MSPSEVACAQQLLGGGKRRQLCLTDVVHMNTALSKRISRLKRGVDVAILSQIGVFQILGWQHKQCGDMIFFLLLFYQNPFPLWSKVKVVRSK